MTTTSSVDFSRLKVLCFLEGPAAAVLTFILKSGTNAPSPPITLEQYLNALPQTSTANYCQLSNRDRRKVFTNTERQQISSDLSWDRFDVSLLYKAIRHACENVAHLNDNVGWRDMNSLEGLITKIKDERNKCVHERPQLTQTEFEAKVSELEDLFVKVLQAAQTRYNISDQAIANEKRSAEKGIKDILKCFTVEEFLCLTTTNMLQVFKNMIINRLCSTYERAQTFDPLCFLTGSPQTQIHIQNIFSKILLKEKPKDVEIPHLEILKHTQSLGQPTQATQPAHPVHPQLLLINGVAGSGKTTLILFILSEWMKEECDRHIKNLNQYDFILRILCRERRVVSLQEFIEEVLPEAVLFRPYTMSLLKAFNILFLIDGLDERNSSSRLLVEDILQQGKEVPGFSIICSSRPESVLDFVGSAPTEYRRGEVVMQGISPRDRTEFVMKYYASLCAFGSSNPVRVRQIMERIGWREHFGLPLNLLFLATLFYDNPDAVKENTTQSSLYATLHDWSVEKLQHRLAVNPQSRDIDRISREEAISSVFSVIGKVALADLLQDVLSLSNSDMRQLRECCQENNLPREEIMGAFFSLRQSVVRRKVIQTYHAPHKALQEFYASKEIVNQLLEEGSSVSTVRRLLQETSRKPIELHSLRNLFLCVVGLLCQPDVKPLPTIIEEVVDLLAESGMKKCNDWLSMLEDTEVNATALERVAMQIRRKGDESLMVITDSTVTSAAALLPLIPTKKVEIVLKRNEIDDSTFSRTIAGHNCMAIVIWQHYKQPDVTSTSDAVLRAVSRNQVKWFAVHLSSSGINLLLDCHSLKYLYLALSGGPDTSRVLSAIAVVCPSLPNLLWLCVHVPVREVQPGDLTRQLPRLFHSEGNTKVVLTLSGVEDSMLDKTCEIAAKLQPRDRYWSITFPDTTMKAEEWHCLIDLMGTNDVKVLASFRVPDTIPMTAQQEDDLNTITKSRMRCPFIRGSEDNLWGWWY